MRKNKDMPLDKPDSPDQAAPAGPPKHPNKHLTFIYIFILVLIVIGIVVVAATSKTSAPGAVSSSTAPAEVSITKTGFMPSTVSISAGQAVVWVNNDSSLHLVASDPYPADNNLSLLNSRTPLTPGQNYSYVFNKAGTYSYHDNLNPYAFKGIVVVK